jgi:hypothetical protein
VYSTTKRGPAEDLPHPYNKIHLRSSWERNFARFLCKNNFDWTYEQRSFSLTHDPKTGKQFKTKPWVYIPDFETGDGTIWEIKGYFRASDRSKIRRMRKCHPEDLKKIKVCLSKRNKKAISFYSDEGIPTIFIEDLEVGIPNWE